MNTQDLNVKNIVVMVLKLEVTGGITWIKMNVTTEIDVQEMDVIHYA